MSELIQPGNDLDAQSAIKHPDADQLSAFAEHTLPEHEHRETLIHLADCAVCRNIVALGSLPPLEEPLVVESVVASQSSDTGGLLDWSRSRTLLWTAVSALAAVFILVVYLQTRSHGESVVAPSTPVAKMHAPENAVAPQIPASPKGAAPPQALRPTPPPAPVASESKIAVTAQSAKVLPLGSRDLRVAKPAPPALVNRPKDVAHGTIDGVYSGRGADLGISNRSPRQAAAPRRAASAPRRRATPPHQVTPDAAASVSAVSSDSSAPRMSISEKYRPDGTAARASDSFKNTSVSIQAALPSGQSILSFAASQRQRIAIDTGHQLFFSEDAGQHWRSVPSPWSGRAIAISSLSPVTVRAQPSQQALAFAVPERFTPGETAVVESDMPSNRLSGRVTGTTGAAIAHAMVVLTESRTGSVRTVETDAGGNYLLSNFVPGLYRIDTQLSGFRNRSLLVDLSSASQTVRNITLESGQVSQTMTVEASNELLQVQSRETSVPSPKIKHVSVPQPASFVVITDAGERWSSSDGLNWKQE